LFVGISLSQDASGEHDGRLGDVEGAGHPAVRLSLSDPYEIGAEFFRWEFATAVAGAVLGVNPFDQPNVAESKQNTKRALSAGGGAKTPRDPRRSGVVSFTGAVRSGDYVCIQAYLEPCERHDVLLGRLCSALRDRVEAAVTVGYGPRYLHSTGQLHKGGAPTGHFIQLLDSSEPDVAIPGAPYTFGQLLAAQAAGDREALTARGRPVISAGMPADLLELL
jgi:hypothetical protein